MTPEEALALLREIRGKVATAAPECAMAMGRTHERHLTHVTLMESGAHPPVTQTPAAPGAPPASITGTLRRSVTCVAGAQGGSFATSLVGPHVIYDSVQEWGAVHHGAPKMLLWVKYLGAAEVRRRGWDKETVTIPPRPYMRPSAAAVVASGEVVRAANIAFVAHVWG